MKGVTALADNKENTKLPFFGIPTLWPYVKKYKKLMVRMVVLGLIVSLADAVFPLFNRYAINHFIGEKTLDTLPFFIGLYFLLILVQCICNF